MQPSHLRLIRLALVLTVAPLGLLPAWSAPASQAQTPPSGQVAYSQDDTQKIVDDAQKLSDKAVGMPLSDEKVSLLKEAYDVCKRTGIPALYLPFQDKWAAAVEQLAQKKTGDAKAKADAQANAAKTAGAKADAFARGRKAEEAGDWPGCLAEVTSAKDLAAGDKAFEALRLRCEDKQSKRKVRITVVVGLLLLAGAVVVVMIVLHFKTGRRRLEMVEGPEPGRVFKLEKELIAIGGAEAEDVDWVIPDPYHTISRRHCEVARSGRHFFVVDRSRNGTFVNGRAIRKDEPVLLRRNDEITLADRVVLIFR